MTGCESMLEAFILGGDFHSRTAIDMYDHVQEVLSFMYPKKRNTHSRPVTAMQ